MMPRYLKGVMIEGRSKCKARVMLTCAICVSTPMAKRSNQSVPTGVSQENKHQTPVMGIAINGKYRTTVSGWSVDLHLAMAL